MAEKKETLAFVAKKFSEAQLCWALIGSANLALQGMFIAPNDINILLSVSDKEKVKKIFSKEKLIRSSELKNKEGEEMLYLIQENEVQFCFERAHGFYAKFLKNNKFRKIKLGSVEISCNLLEDEIKAYEFLGKKEKAESIREFLRTNVSADFFKKILDFAQEAYHNSNITGQAMSPGGPFPYFVHPLWCAMILANDRRLSKDERVAGFQALILHDVLEDTAKKLPTWVSVEVADLVRELTFESWEEKKKQVKSKSKFVKLLLLADGLANMYEETIRENKKTEYKQQTAYLLKEAQKNYPQSRIVEIGKAIIENTNW